MSPKGNMKYNISDAIFYDPKNDDRIITGKFSVVNEVGEKGGFYD